VTVSPNAPLEPENDPDAADLERVRRMKMGEVMRILDDPTSPLHAAASQVAAEVTRPLAEMSRDLLKPMVDIVARTSGKAAADALGNINWAGLLPRVDLGPVLAAYTNSTWLSKLSSSLPQINISKDMLQGLRSALPATLKPPVAPILPEIDYFAADPPDLATDIVAAVNEAHVDSMREAIVGDFPKIVGALTSMENQMATSSALQQRGLKVAIWTLAIAALGIVVQLIIHWIG